MILIDSHVHIYSNFDLKVFFDSAARNLIKYTPESTRIKDLDGVLFLTESDKLHYFSKLKDKEITISNWSFLNTCEENSFIMISGQGLKLVIIKGQQINTREKLEVLSVGTRGIGNDNELEYTILTILKSGGLPVIPWGFGKWWGKRGDILTKLLMNSNLSCIFLGDNGGRTKFLPYPTQFLIASRKGIKILPGSDPLPIRNDVRRVGSYGFVLEGMIDRDYPARYIISRLVNMKNNPSNFGALSTATDFFERQAILRIKKLIN